jgi:hypothetical protein
MFRERRKQLRRRRRRAVVGVAIAVTAFVVGVPTLAAADPVSDLLHNLGLDGSGAGGSGGAVSGGGTATPDAGNPPAYTPPLHGTEPHGQGTDAVADLTPGTSAPLPSDPGDGDEELIVGDSRGQQNSDGSYHGRVTLAYLLGTPIIQVTSDPGQSNDGPLQPVQDALDQLCTGSGNQLCLTILGMHSASTGNSSTNSLEVLGAHIGGPSGINADVLTSNGNISDDGTTQTAHGDSGVAKANVGPLTLDALEGSSDSTAGSGGSSVNQDSTVLNIGGTGLPIPAAGCDNGTPNTNFTPLSPLLATVCNADDSNGSQAGSPYGVREALTLFALITGNSSLLKVGTAGPESHAVAPGSTTTPPGGETPGGGGTKGAGGKGGNNGGNGGGGNGGGAGAGNGPAAGTAAPGNGQLAFTGADLLALAMVGGALILGGLALTTAGRRHRQTV